MFHRPGPGGSLLSSNSYNADGNTAEFGFGITPQNAEGLVVRLNDIIQNPNTYKVDYRLKKVKFKIVPQSNTSVNIISVSGNGENIIEFDEFIADGSTVQYVTKARYTKDVDYYATVDGVDVKSVLIPSSDSTDQDAKCVIVFGSPPRDLRGPTGSHLRRTSQAQEPPCRPPSCKSSQSLQRLARSLPDCHPPAGGHRPTLSSRPRTSSA